MYLDFFRTNGPDPLGVHFSISTIMLGRIHWKRSPLELWRRRFQETAPLRQARGNEVLTVGTCSGEHRHTMSLQFPRSNDGPQLAWQDG